MKRIFVYVLGCVVLGGGWNCPEVSAQAAVEGRVTCEGKGVSGVVVTDGQTCVTTDREGRYVLPAIDLTAEFVYVSTPAGYLPPDSAGIPRFYRAIDRAKPQRHDFTLRRNPKDDQRHLLVVHADPQFFSEENFASYVDIVADCRQTVDAYRQGDVFGIDCGDLVGDKPELYNRYIDELSRTGVPFYRVLGNHDMHYGGRTDELSTATYTRHFGPAYYSFNRGKVHYIVLDNVFYIGRDHFYMGYITEKMFRWLEQDLSHVPAGSTVFVAMHIPARLAENPEPFTYSNEQMGGQTINAQGLFELLKPYQAHILTGHMHYNKNIVHSPQLYEHNTAAICGTWWQGAYCLDGTPLGYGVYEVDGDRVTWYFKSAGHPRDYQMRGFPVGANTEFPDDVTVNIWNWDAGWKVEWYEDGHLQGEMTRFDGIDPEVVTMCADKERLRFKWIAPIKTAHMFRATPASRQSTVEIVATDRFENQYKTSIQPTKNK